MPDFINTKNIDGLTGNIQADVFIPKGSSLVIDGCRLDGNITNLGMLYTSKTTVTGEVYNLGSIKDDGTSALGDLNNQGAVLIGNSQNASIRRDFGGYMLS